MKVLPLLAVGVVFFLTGCGTADVDVTSWERRTLLKDNVNLSDVRLSAQLLSHNDRLVAFGMTNQIASEKIFRTVFTGNDDAPATLYLVSAKVSKNEFSLTDRLAVTYQLSVVLKTKDGQRHELTATATSNRMTIDRAMREAIEIATLDLARQCKSLLGT